MTTCRTIGKSIRIETIALVMRCSFKTHVNLWRLSLVDQHHWNSYLFNSQRHRDWFACASPKLQKKLPTVAVDMINLSLWIFTLRENSRPCRSKCSGNRKTQKASGIEAIFQSMCNGNSREMWPWGVQKAVQVLIDLYTFE